LSLLVISPDYASHLLPMATLAKAWADAGERVIVGTGPAVAPIVDRFGFEHALLRLGRGSNAGVIRPEDQPPGESDSLRAFFAATRDGMIPTLMYQADARGDDLLWEPLATATAVLRIVDRVRPDAIVVDHLAFSATLALRAARIPYADVVLGHPTAHPVGDEIYGEAVAWPPAFRPNRGAAAALRRRCAVVRDRFTGTYNDTLLTLDPTADAVPDAFAAHGATVLYNYPEALHDPARTKALPTSRAFLGSLVRPEAAGPDSAAWLDRDDPRPIVYVSFGSFLSARSDVLAKVVDALRDRPLRVALAIGSAPAAAIGPTPADWLVRTYLPQVAILEHASVAVTHAGNNSVTEALTAGVPLVALPFSTDQFAGAASTERAGLGVALDPNSVTADAIAAAVADVSARPYRSAAASLRETLLADPGPVRARRAVDALSPAVRPGA
jgi:zeaxanthin glucosyltransferase